MKRTGLRPEARGQSILANYEAIETMSIFEKIIAGEIPSDMVYQDELVTAFRDINPQAPTHILIVPNVVIPTVNDVSADNELALGRMITVAKQLAESEASPKTVSV